MISLKSILWWFGVSLDYVAAGGLIALGVYVTLYWQHRFARVIGMMLLGAGIGWGCFAFGKTVGGSHCYAEWRAANERARIEAINRDNTIAKHARELVEKQTAELSEQNKELRQKLRDYEDATKNAPACRRATADDIRRLCAITRGAAPGCKGAK